MKVKFIFIGVVCMICLGAGILCRDTISHSIFKSGTRMSAWDNMKVDRRMTLLHRGRMV